ncbi:hypothetical protein [Nocardioides iriomotensis]|uniref:Uncharacterized protein n=1 Tax=Nocardioides iriomotensis TaxID=715784 RepID=A0A4Q5J6Q2_9ACTN|nr:hypothetical protein [Nocardioides iriomotensis]RYU14327.1 hypothetical protein ETU37_03725 [Nocardioides iriomotensis]
MTALRLLTGVVGLAALGWGIRLLLRLDLGDLLNAGLWMAGAVLAHDALVAPAVVLIGLAAARFVPTWARPAVAAVGVVVGTMTLALLPTLGRFGAKVDDPFLLNRAYGAWWLALTSTAVVVGLLVALRSRRASGADGP